MTGKTRLTSRTARGAVTLLLALAGMFAVADLGTRAASADTATSQYGTLSASDALLAGYFENRAVNPSSTRTFTLCRNVVRPGVFTISAIMHIDTGKADLETVALSPAQFVMSRQLPSRRTR